MGKIKFCSFNLILFLCIFSFLVSVSRCQTLTDTIKPGDSLGPTLTSANGRFTLGFFNISSNGYLGIWINSDYKAVWVANGSVPLVSNMGNLIMDADGVLTVSDNGENVFSLNSGFSSPNSSAVLNNSGNLVVTELNADGTAKQILWQSFDYPTDTLLPGMKLGINHRTGHTWSLTSWLTDERPAAGGGFSVDWNSTGTNEIVVRRLDQVYWTSGTVTDHDLKNVASLRSSQYRYNFTIISTTEESSFSYSLAEDKESWWVVSPTGDFTDGLRMAYILEVKDCKVDGSSNSFPGCAKQESPSCRSEDQELVKKSGSFYGPSIWSVENSTYGPENCWEICWKTCSCIGYYVIGNINVTTCHFWDVGKKFTLDESGDSQKYYVLSTPKPKGHSLIFSS